MPKSTIRAMPIADDDMTIRHPAVAGTFYPRDRDLLWETVGDLLAGAQSVQHEQIRAVIAPHAGYIYSGAVAAEAFAGLRGLRGRIERLVVIGPAHFVYLSGIAAPTASAFRTPLGDVPVDTAAIAEIAHMPQVAVDDQPHAPEHALEIELPFLQATLGAVPIVPLLVGSARAEEVAEVLHRLWDARTLVVVSSDLSHYNSYETARRLDAVTADAIERLDEKAIGSGDACGSVAVRGLLIEARRRGLAIERLDLRNSGDTAGDPHRVVGYGAWVVLET
ncbi:MAG: AmmeMemoRadiSam system protein B [Hyphomicrobiales bacterium]|nr:AmmeMemoRadiSam system protein B [Hyphomicrobiales bacterium]